METEKQEKWNELGEFGEDGERKRGFRDKLSVREKVCYSLPRGATVGMGLLLQTTGRLYYVENLGMSAAVMAMLVAVCKCLDLLLGFAIGYWTDNCESKWGRRKPFIMIGFPLWLVSLMLIHTPPTSLGVDTDNSISKIDYYDVVDGECNALGTELDRAIYNEEIPVYDEDIEFDDDHAGAGLSLYFATFYFMFYSLGWTTTIIPYDALGMELTDDHDERSSVFGYKGCSQNIGYMIHGILTIAFSAAFSEDLRKQLLYPSLIWVVLVSLAFIVMLKNVPERPVCEMQAKSLRRSIIPTVRTLFANRPYIIYLWMKVPAAVAGLMPVNLLIYYVKIVMREENPTFYTGVVTVVVVAAAVLSIPGIVRAAQRWGKQKTLLVICFVQGFLFMIGAFIPALPVTVIFLGAIVGVGIAGTNILPDAILADIIDYDELHTGDRSEGTYTVVETNLQQFIEIAAGTIPLLVFHALGFNNNGGCRCGCGSECDDEFLRWNCPGDIGYACDDDLYYGDEDRDAPCTEQNVLVQAAVRFFFVFFPGVCLWLAMIPIYHSPITAEVHQAITTEKEKRLSGETAVDPITGLEIRPKEKTPENDLAAHFTPLELSIARSGPDGIFRLRRRLLSFVCLWLAGITGLIVMMAVFAEPYTVTICSILMSAAVVLLVWDTQRLRVAKSPASDQLMSMYIPDDELPAARAKHDAVDREKMPICCFRWKMWFGVGSLVAAGIFFGLSLTIVDIVNDAIDEGVEEGIVIDPEVWGEEDWEDFHTSDHDYTIYVFNVTNALAVQEEGAVPIIEEIKVEMTYTEENYNSTVENGVWSYASWWDYVPKYQRVEDLLQAEIVQINPVYVSGVAAMANTESELFVGISFAVVDMVKALMEVDFMSFYRPIMLPAYMEYQATVMISGGLAASQSEVAHQWGRLDPYTTGVVNVDPTNLWYFTGFEMTSSTDVILSETQAEYLWDSSNPLALTNTNDGMGLWVWLAAAMDPCDDTCAASRAAIVATLDAMQAPDGLSGENAMNAVLLWLGTITHESNDAYRYVIGSGLVAAGAITADEFADLHSWEHYGDLQFGTGKLTTAIDPTYTSVMMFGLDPRIIVPPEISAYSNNTILMTVNESRAFLDTFADYTLSVTFITRIGLGDYSVLAEAPYNGCGITIDNLAGVMYYLMTYLPQELLIRGFTVGFQVADDGSFYLKPDGTGTENSGMFTRRTIEEIMFGYHDALFDLLPADMAPFPLVYDGVFGPRTSGPDEHYTYYGGNPPPYIVHSGQNDINRIREYIAWRGISSFHTAPEIGNSCPAEIITTDCRVWLEREYIEGHPDGANYPPFQEDETPTPVITQWSSETMRVVNLTYEGDYKEKDVKLRKYALDEASLLNVTFNHNNYNYRMTGPNNMADLTSAAAGSPTWLSRPNFWQAESEGSKFIGIPVLSAEESEARYLTYFGVEPLTGYVMEGAKRLQFNFKVSDTMFDSDVFRPAMQTSPDGVYYWPYLWVDESDAIKRSDADAFVANVYDMRDVADGVESVGLTIGVLLAVLGALVIVSEFIYQRRAAGVSESMRQAKEPLASL